ncbi:MAG: glycosyltransferase family 4 protein [Chloroflexota bacterium]|nr:glycosyltransferase family 4 protein [Chloroflexota bacterium]
MSSIRVGTITFAWYPFDSRLRRLAEAAVDGGYAMDIICLRQAGEKAYEVCSGVHVYRMPMNRTFGRGMPVMIMSWCQFLVLATVVITRLHLKQRYDVVHVHNMPDFMVFAALFVKLLGAKIILDVRDVSPELMAAKSKGRMRKLVVPLAALQERISAAFAQHIVTVGWPFEEALLRRGIPQAKITNILNSSDPKIFPIANRQPSPADATPREQPFILMYHGTLAWRNGLDIAIRALTLARQTVPDVRLDIMGRGEEMPHLKQLAAELGIADHVVFIDPCPLDKVVDFVLHGDVGIIPYRYDGFMELVLPTKAYEFAWMERPMIASDTPAIRSMFRPESLVRCDPLQVESFAEAIIDLYQHPEKRALMVQNAAEDYQPFRWEMMAERYRQLLAAVSRKKMHVRRPVVSRVSSQRGNK